LRSKSGTELQPQRAPTVLRLGAVEMGFAPAMERRCSSFGTSLCRPRPARAPRDKLMLEPV